MGFVHETPPLEQHNDDHWNVWMRAHNKIYRKTVVELSLSLSLEPLEKTVRRKFILYRVFVCASTKDSWPIAGDVHVCFPKQSERIRESEAPNEVDAELTNRQKERQKHREREGDEITWARQIEIKLQPRRWMQPHLNVFYKRWELLI